MNRPMVYKREGFSLIEVLIALVFLAIGLLAVASLQVTSVRGNFFSNNLMQATYVAQDRLESLGNRRYRSDELKE
jgi:type IV pilus assembly protein PilV